MQKSYAKEEGNHCQGVIYFRCHYRKNSTRVVKEGERR
jgi:hypothetical protein